MYSEVPVSADRPPSRVDALIVNYRTAALTRQAAVSVAGPGVRVLVWDNSGDVTHEPDVWSLHSCGSNINYAAGNNRLFALSSAPFVLLLNPDVQLDYRAAQAMAHRLNLDPSAWGTVPRLLNPDGSDQNYYRRMPTYASMLADRMPVLRGILRGAWTAHTYSDLGYVREGEVEAPAAACLMLKRSALGSADVLFDEQFPLFFNDTDLAARLNPRNGRCRYEHDLTAIHLRGASLEQERAVRRHAVAASYDESAVRFARKHFGRSGLLDMVTRARGVAYRLHAAFGALRPPSTG